MISGVVSYLNIDRVSIYRAKCLGIMNLKVLPNTFQSFKKCFSMLLLKSLMMVTNEGSICANISNKETLGVDSL